MHIRPIRSNRCTKPVPVSSRRLGGPCVLIQLKAALRDK